VVCAQARVISQDWIGLQDWILAYKEIGFLQRLITDTKMQCKPPVSQLFALQIYPVISKLTRH
jgi:hypothetical protein